MIANLNHSISDHAKKIGNQMPFCYQTFYYLNGN